MRVILAAVGKLKDGPERALCQRYHERFDQTGGQIALGPLKLVEHAESRATTADLRKADEAQRLLGAVAGAERLIALDERGTAMGS
ncbi:MAG: 23S rRNA (pseudouridine(1915)-N(3))-methyltransferase RlmH, partial [Sphingomonadales bacterium]|nr:23S rRNA (pseudouridine(1915)-N(3))-methyltransferase RlmH [Sphingomonadales bacterium]